MEEVTKYILPDELYHHGVKGMKWGVRRYQNADGSLNSAGRRHQAKVEKRQATKDYNKAYNKAYNYSGRHYVSQFFGRHKKVSDNLWNDVYDKAKISREKDKEYKKINKEYKNERRTQRNETIKNNANKTMSYLKSDKGKRAMKVGAVIVASASATAGYLYVNNKQRKNEAQRVAKYGKRFYTDGMNQITKHPFRNSSLNDDYKSIVRERRDYIDKSAKELAGTPWYNPSRSWKNNARTNPDRDYIIRKLLERNPYLSS